MSQKSVFKPNKPYKPRRLVNGFCVPVGETGKEDLVCVECGPKPFVIGEPESGTLPDGTSFYRIPATGDWPFPVYGERPKFIPVTFDGKVKCAHCSKQLR